MSVVARTIFSWLAVLCLVLQVAPGVMASSLLDEADEVASSSLWPFEGVLVAHGGDSESDDSDSESDDSDSESDDSDSESDDSDSESDDDSESDTDS